MEKVEWSAEASKALKPILFDVYEQVKENVRAGEYDLFRYPDGTWMVIWIDRANKEITGIGMQGKGYVEKVQPWIDKAVQYGYSIRIHTHRKGISRLLERMGFEFEFITMVKK